MQEEDAADVVTNVARKFLTAMSVKPGTSGTNSLWNKIEGMVDYGSESGKQSGDMESLRSTSALWASAGGAMQTL